MTRARRRHFGPAMFTVATFALLLLTVGAPYTHGG
jgi:hypothetical protein